jgi:hypothetical protein
VTKDLFPEGDGDSLGVLVRKSIWQLRNVPTFGLFAIIAAQWGFVISHAASQGFD